ncbi:MAG: ABC transporter substrate-binding protein [Litorilituus sp.]|jgi:NitT/TauT family transport system substrate-binding protein|nr:ABC transporter substrate-binding protein [Litorilituus sp.]
MKLLIILFAYAFFIASTQAQSSTEIKLAGPTAVISYPLMVMAREQTLANKNIKLTFTRWKNPDQLRAMIVSEQIDFSAMPSNLAAIFHNKGQPIKLLNISVWDIMTVVSSDPNIKTLADLKGEEIVVPFKSDMPTILLNQLLNKQLGSKSKSVKQRVSHNLLDSSQLLLAGQVDHALLIEPVTSMVIHQNNKRTGNKIQRVLNISTLWKDAFPEAPRLAQAGLIANGKSTKDSELMEAINKAYSEKAIWCKSNPDDCADVVKHYLPKAPKPSLINAIKHTELSPQKASEAQNAIEQFYKVLLNTNNKLIGGKLPTPEFYL